MPRYRKRCPVCRGAVSEFVPWNFGAGGAVRQMTGFYGLTLIVSMDDSDLQIMRGSESDGLGFDLCPRCETAFS